MAETFDFSGWATRNNLRCSDGRTIRKDAFKENDGDVVPLIWQHDHTSPASVIGHALLENRDEGVYAYCALNQSEGGKAAKEAVNHGDVDSLSIYANQLRQNNNGDVYHGTIREVSLVLHGANPGAYIDNVVQHGDMEVYDEEGRIYSGEIIDTETEYELYHADEEDEDDMADTNKKTTSKSEDEETVADVFNTLTEKQKTVVYYIIGKSLENADASSNNNSNADNKVKHSDIEGDDSYMAHYNVFENQKADTTHIAHAEDLRAEKEAIFADAKRLGSLKDAVLQHAANYGIDNIDWLFPDAKLDTTTLEYEKRDDEWVNVFLNNATKSPFARVRSIYADITADEARAKGFTKGNRKTEEIISLIRRKTGPTTIYKKQKFDRDDIIDITEFDIVSSVKAEMRMQLNVETALAALLGDGRSIVDQDKIDESCIRPIYTDDEFYSHKAVFTPVKDDDAEKKTKDLIRFMVKERRNYKGTGDPIMFTTSDVLTDMLLLEDGVGRPLYDTVEKLATKLRVSRIVTVEQMENRTRNVDGEVRALIAILVNPRDYKYGTDKGGQISMFDDFDLDFNQMIYLMEGRCSGALTKPHSAIVVEMVATPMSEVGITIAKRGTTAYGKEVGDLQTGVALRGDTISGSLYYVDDFTGFSVSEELQKGNYLVLNVIKPTGADTVKVKVTGGKDTAEKDVDDQPLVIRVLNPNQKVIIKATKDEDEVTKTYSLTGLRLLSAGDSK